MAVVVVVVKLYPPPIHGDVVAVLVPNPLNAGATFCVAVAVVAAVVAAAVATPPPSVGACDAAVAAVAAGVPNDKSVGALVLYMDFEIININQMVTHRFNKWLHVIVKGESIQSTNS